MRINASTPKHPESFALATESFKDQRQPGVMSDLNNMSRLPLTQQNRMTPRFIQEMIDASGANVVILDKYQTILYVNRAWREFATRTGSMTDQFGIGNRYPDMGLGTAATTQSDKKIISKGIGNVIAKVDVEFDCDYRSTAVAEPVWFRLHAAAFRFSRHIDEPLILVSHVDITEEMQSSVLLAKDRERLARLLAATNILPWEADARTWIFTYVGEQAEQILGYANDEWLEPDFWTSRIHPDDKERAIAECTRLSQTSDQYQFEYRMIAKDGGIVWINDTVSVHRENGVPVTISGFMIDVTERKQTEITLRLLGGRLITAQEEERKRIARDLHDDLNQRMALLSIELEQIGQSLVTQSAGVSERVRELQKKALRISSEIHRMSYSLHPSKLDHLGLVPALRSFCDEIYEARGLLIDFRQEGFPAKLPSNMTLCLFRIAQECLQNAAKHSGATRVDIMLKKTDTAVKMIISDKGCGFVMTSERLNQGLGFISMRERLRLVDGDIKIESAPSRGTRVSILVPLSNAISVQPLSTGK